MYVDMVSSYLQRKGKHKVKALIAPFDIKEVAAFNPDVIIITLVRKMESISAGSMSDFYQEVEGAKALRDLSLAMDDDPETLSHPVILVSIAVREVEVPSNFPYIAFIEMPGTFDKLFHAIEQAVAAKGSKLIGQ
jgi:hypothetical protein